MELVGGVQEIKYYSNDGENIPLREGEGNIKFFIALQGNVYLKYYF